jgi:twitching motility protein PilT
MEEGDYYGMQTFDKSLLSLYEQGRITLEDATVMAANPHDFKIKLRQLGVTGSEAAKTGVY